MHSSLLDSPPATSSLRFVTIGGRDVMLALSGPVDGVLTERGVGLLRVACRTGARNILVDLTDTTGILPASLTAVLPRLAADLESVGGWVLVVGAPDGAGITEPDLAVAFDAYRHVRRDPAVAETASRAAC
jgi:hypothetical protein